jgi:hypothetical protein
VLANRPQCGIDVPYAPARRVLDLPPAATVGVAVGLPVAQEYLDIPQLLLHHVVQLLLVMMLVMLLHVHPVFKPCLQHASDRDASLKVARVQALQQKLSQVLRSRGSRR